MKTEEIMGRCEETLRNVRIIVESLSRASDRLTAAMSNQRPGQWPEWLEYVCKQVTISGNAAIIAKITLSPIVDEMRTGMRAAAETRKAVDEALKVETEGEG